MKSYIRDIMIVVLFSVCPFALDLAFLLDASGSIGKNSYEDMKGFINEVIENFHVSNEGKHNTFKRCSVQ